MDFPNDSMVKNLPTVQETQEKLVQFLGQEDPLKEDMATHSNILAWKMSWTEKVVGDSPWGGKESDTTEHVCMLMLSMGYHTQKLEVLLLCFYFTVYSEESVLN